MTDRPRPFNSARGRDRDSANAPLRVLFLCTGNSARSQIAEALLAKKGAGRFEARSAGTQPRSIVHPDAVAVLGEFGIDWQDRVPKSIDAVRNQSWDFVITVCDRAKESCPSLPGQPIFAHWGMPDPADVEDPGKRMQAFRATLTHLNRRLDLMLALPFESLARQAAEERLQRIGLVLPEPIDTPARE